jgi:hypothetical protein
MFDKRTVLKSANLSTVRKLLHPMKNKTLFYLSLAVGIYILLLYLNGYVFKYSFTWIGVVQELLTIPTLILSIVLLVVAVRRYASSSHLRDSYLSGSLVILSVSLVAILRSLTVFLAALL